MAGIVFPFTDRTSTRRADLRAWRQAAAIAGPIVAMIAVPILAAIPFLTHAAPSTKPARTIASPAPPIASPAIGTTGTIALPQEPAAWTGGDPGVVPARRFSLRGVGDADRARAVECLTAAIYYEAASESDDGQRAVAQVVLNRVRHPACPASVCGVVYQGADRAEGGCQFSFACDGATARVPARGGWARAARIAVLALNGQVFAPVGLATHYHTFAVTPAWNRALVMTDAIGAHFFHRWKGYWGTAAAFHQPYTGHEPPLAARAPAMVEAPSPSAMITPPAPVAPIPVADVRPAHADSGAVAATLPESGVLDRWKESGQPLR